MLGLFAAPITQAIVLYCGYKSFKAIESDKGQDDTKWLTFWFVYSIVAFAKSILDYVSVIIPFYEEAYIAFLLFLGFFGGADMIYSQFLRPFLKEHEALIDEKLKEARKAAEDAAAQAQTMAGDLRAHAD